MVWLLRSYLVRVAINVFFSHPFVKIDADMLSGDWITSYVCYNNIKLFSMVPMGRYARTGQKIEHLLTYKAVQLMAM